MKPLKSLSATLVREARAVGLLLVALAPAGWATDIDPIVVSTYKLDLWSSYDSKVQGTYAYLAGDGGLEIIDLSNPAQPVQLGSFAHEAVYSVAISGTQAYCVVGNRLLVIDVKDPANPVLAGSMGMPQSFETKIAVSGQHAYITGNVWDDSVQLYGWALIVVDLTDALHPQLLTTVDLPPGSHDLAVTDGFAYVAAGDAGLQVIDISDATNPEVVSSFTDEIQLAVRCLAVSGEYAYLAGWGYDEETDTYGTQVVVLNVSAPTYPQLVGKCMFRADGGPRSLAVRDDYLCIGFIGHPSAGSEGFVLIDVQNPSTPYLAGHYPTGLQSRSVAVLGKHAIVAAGDELVVLDMAVKANPRPVGVYDTLGGAGSIAISGDLAYIAASGYGDGVEVLDISNPITSIQLAAYEASNHVTTVAASGTYAYFGVADGELQILDTSDPSKPQLLAVHNAPGSIRSVEVSGGHAYLLSNGWWDEAARLYRDTFQIIDISDPMNPRRASALDMAEPQHIVVSDGHAYVCGGWWEDPSMRDALVVVEVSDAASPQRVGSLEASDYASAIGVSDGHAYLGVQRVGLAIVDVADPSHPSVVGTFHTRRHIGCIAVSGSYVYLGGYHGLEVVNISTPTDPQRVGGNSVFRRLSDLALHADHILVASEGVLGTLRMSPFIRSISMQGSTVELLWERFGLTRLQHTTSLDVPEWADLIGSESVNKVALPIWEGSEYFRVSRYDVGNEGPAGVSPDSNMYQESRVQHTGAASTTIALGKEAIGGTALPGQHNGDVQHRASRVSRQSLMNGEALLDPLSEDMASNARRALRQLPSSRDPRSYVGFAATPGAVVDKMLELADLAPGDVVYDLGCGDGRIVIAAAKQYGVRAVGIDIDPAMVHIARANVEASGVSHLVRIDEGDLFTADLSEATVVTLYLSQSMNNSLKAKLAHLRSEARVVSHDSSISGMRPAGIHSMIATDDDGHIARHMIYSWLMP